MNHQQKEAVKETLITIGLCFFMMFMIKACVIAENDWLLEQDRIQAEKREIWLEQQNQLNGEQR